MNSKSGPRDYNNICQTQSLSLLDNSNVFVFDTETTGLPMRAPAGWGSHWDYRLNEKYEGCRIISIAWSFTSNYKKNILDKSAIQHYYRYPEGFTEITSTHIHGIKYNDILTTGIPFGVILGTYGLGKALLDANYIVAHNAKFDYNVLMNELYRLAYNNEPVVSLSLATRELAVLCINHLLSLTANNKIICTGEISTNICKMDFPNATTYLGKKKTYKMPKLCELYKYYYGIDFENAHSADGDVKALLDIMKMM